ncbi:siroheme synthase [Thermodesulfatator indicus DSM 15286]|uniref:precorrin-2 dehydrogenase n=1 Tax=Thermodesulfatator indicus (strain DSM 15286 / JCM 11887 / CIR29812) TaxID=667014 RepID=F8A9C1_THEID|nr:bifunctional precorrin-2 dehydrogenase/sirohydrochlorin ferrochelatase [Thermodesulfatator indicus]AEH44062.1 siroheme synthase [Thermodesulfatator indicus DSM 15286]
MAKYYPIFLKIEQKLCVVIGGGKVAARKIKTLLEAGAKVKVISPEVIREIEKLSEQGQVEWIKRPYRKGDLEDAFLVYAATDDPTVQKQVFAEAEEKNIFCNVVDKPALCSFIVPSIVKRGKLQIAISTSGASPALARRLREQFEETFGPEYAEYLELMARWREEILARDLSEKEKRQIFEQLVLAPVPLWLKRGERHHVKSLAKTFNLSFEE